MEARVPPYDMESEIALLGSILSANDVIPVIRGEIEPESFYLEIHRIIYRAMLEVYDAHKPVDYVTLGEHLQKNGGYEKVGGISSLTRLSDNVATVTNVAHYAAIVKEKHCARLMIYAAQEIVARGFGDYGEIDDYFSNCTTAITSAAGTLVRGDGPRQIDDDLKQLVSDLEKCEEPKGIVKTGVSVIDSTTGGLMPGLLYVVGARPAMGKSAFALNIAINAAIAGYKVLFVTLEDVRKYVVARLMSRFADIDFQNIMLRKKMGIEEWGRIIKAYTKLSGKKPIWIEDVAGLTSNAIVQRAVQLKATEGLDLVVIDHLGEVADKADTEKAKLEGAARNFRDAAKTQDIPYLLLHQLNRYVEHRPDKMPGMVDLNQAGQLEAIARCIWFIMRPGYYEPDDDDRFDMQMLVAKATHGKTGLIRLWQDWSRMYFRSWDVSRDGLFPGDNTEEEAREAIIEFTGLQEEEFELQSILAEFEHNMELAARNLQFEKAIEYREKIRELKKGK